MELEVIWKIHSCHIVCVCVCCRGVNGHVQEEPALVWNWRLFGTSIPDILCVCVVEELMGSSGGACSSVELEVIWNIHS